jgi:hypothetical protein
MNVTQVRKIRHRNSVRGVHRIELSREDGRREEYRLLRGAVTWPVGAFPGIVLVGAQSLDSETVTILEERPFETVAEAVDTFLELWAYEPSLYYHREDDESEAFISFLLGVPELRGKLPLTRAIHADAVDFGVRVIADFIGRELLSVPPEGRLASELAEAHPDMKPEEMPGITALRYLLAGIMASPTEADVEDQNFARCFV